MKRDRFKFVLWTTASVIIAILIFMFSSQNGEVSGSVSQGITRRIFPSVLSDDVVFVLEKIIRKLAHYGIYFALGVAVCMSQKCFLSGFFGKKAGNILQISVPVAICFLYSVTDEIHQSYIPGRNGAFSDCVLDTFGAFCGVITVILILRISKKAKRK